MAPASRRRRRSVRAFGPVRGKNSVKTGLRALIGPESRGMAAMIPFGEAALPSKGVRNLSQTHSQASCCFAMIFMGVVLRRKAGFSLASRMSPHQLGSVQTLTEQFTI